MPLPPESITPSISALSALSAGQMSGPIRLLRVGASRIASHHHAVPGLSRAFAAAAGLPEFDTIEGTVGRTPLVRLQRLAAPNRGSRKNVVLAKLEGNNPAGSVKDRLVRGVGGRGTRRRKRIQRTSERTELFIERKRYADSGGFGRARGRARDSNQPKAGITRSSLSDLSLGSRPLFRSVEFDV